MDVEKKHWEKSEQEQAKQLANAPATSMNTRSSSSSELSSTTSDSSTSTDSDATSSSEESDDEDFIASKRGMFVPSQPKEAALLYATDPYHLNQVQGSSPALKNRSLLDKNNNNNGISSHRLNNNKPNSSDFDWRAWQKEVGRKDVPPYHPRYDQTKILERMDICKRKHRSSLKSQESWQRYNYADTFHLYRTEWVQRLQEIEKKQYLRQHDPEKFFAQLDNKAENPLAYINAGSLGVDRIDYASVSKEEFTEKYISQNRPCIIRGCMDDWSGRQLWNKDALDTLSLRDASMKCGEDDEGVNVKIRLKYYLQYMHTQKDDSPLYLFDSTFGEKSEMKDIREGYKVPEFFDSDLFNLVPNYDSRPPHRWWCIGPERSGTGLHCDPLATSAWNSVTDGVKYWVLYPPGSKKETVKGIGLREKGEDKEAITWYTQVFPRIKQGLLHANDQYTEVYEFLQYPGETVYVPGGWWHAVVNLTDTVAVTQNFVTCETFERVWRQVRRGRNHMARRWLIAMYESKDGQIHPGSRYPSPSYRKLALLATDLNRRDKFKWKFDKRKKNARYPEPILPPELRYEGDGLPAYDADAARKAKLGHRIAVERKSNQSSKRHKKPSSRTKPSVSSSFKPQPQPQQQQRQSQVVVDSKQNKQSPRPPRKPQSFKLSNGFRNYSESKNKSEEDNLYKSYVTNNNRFKGLNVKPTHVYFPEEELAEDAVENAAEYEHIVIS